MNQKNKSKTSPIYSKVQQRRLPTTTSGMKSPARETEIFMKNETFVQEPK